MLNASDTFVVAGTCCIVCQRFTIGLPSTKRHWNAAKLPNSACTSRNARALPTADSTFARFRTIPGSRSNASIRCRSNCATRAGSKSSKARRYCSRRCLRDQGEVEQVGPGLFRYPDAAITEKLALRARSKRPTAGAVPLRIVWFSGDAFTEGVETHTVEGVNVRVYSPAKTIADLFKFRNKIGGKG